jgi:glycosyltransferase involved in cell wall biosynthesis
VRVTENELSKITTGYEVIIAEDGSTDGTDATAERLASSSDRVRHLHSDQRLGRGLALTRAFSEARGGILVYMDVDLSTETRFLQPLIESIRNGYDISTGSRMLPGSVVKRSRTRDLSSRAYNGLIRFLFHTGIRDHQCGFKAFNRMSLCSILGEVRDSHWFWDTEVLALASSRGLRIKEIPVTWIEDRGTTVNLASDSFRMGLKAISLWWRLRSG